MDETGIIFRALPDKTMHERAKGCSGGKHSMDRVTCLLCVNVGKFLADIDYWTLSQSWMF